MTREDAVKIAIEALADSERHVSGNSSARNLRLDSAGYREGPSILLRFDGKPGTLEVPDGDPPPGPPSRGRSRHWVDQRRFDCALKP